MSYMVTSMFLRVGSPSLFASSKPRFPPALSHAHTLPMYARSATSRKYFLVVVASRLFFFAPCPQDSARLCLFCESVLSLCVLQADPSLNPAAHLAGGTGPSGEGGGKGGSGKGAPTASDPALRLRLRRLLAACLDHAEREVSKVHSGGTRLCCSWEGGDV